MRRLPFFTTLLLISGLALANVDDELNQSAKSSTNPPVDYTLITATDTSTPATEDYKVDNKKYPAEKLYKLSAEEIAKLVEEEIGTEENKVTTISVNKTAADELANYSSSNDQWFVSGFVNIGVGFGPVGIGCCGITTFNYAGYWGVPGFIPPPPRPIIYPVPFGPVPVPFGPIYGPRPFPGPHFGPGPFPGPGPVVYGHHSARRW